MKVGLNVLIFFFLFFLLFNFKSEKDREVVFTLIKNTQTNTDYFINPFKYAPMAVGIHFELSSKKKTDVIATVLIKGHNTPDLVKSYTFTSTPEIQKYWLPILGLYMGKVTIVQIDIKSKDTNILFSNNYEIYLPKTEDYYIDIGKAEQTKVIGEFEGDDMIFVQYNSNPSGVVFRGIVYDKYGNIRWYSKIPNGAHHFIIDTKLYTGLKSDRNEHILVHNFLAKRLEDWKFEGYRNLHHDLVKQVDSHFILTFDNQDSFPNEQHIVEINPNEQAKNKVINCINTGNIFPNVDNLFPNLPEDIDSTSLSIKAKDPIHINSISSYEKNGKTVYVCSSQRSGIAALDEDGVPHWYLFPKGIQYKIFNDKYSGQRLPSDTNFVAFNYSTLPSYQKLLLDPIDKNNLPIKDSKIIDEGQVKKDVDFIYPFRQHGAKVVEYNQDSMTMIVLDNAAFQSFKLYDTLASSYAVCYRVFFDNNPIDEHDPSNKEEEFYGGKIKQLWRYKLNAFSPFMGSSSISASGNYLFCFGTIGSKKRTTGNGYDYNNINDIEGKTIVIELDRNGIEKARLIIETTDQRPLKIGAYRAQKINFGK